MASGADEQIKTPVTMPLLPGSMGSPHNARFKVCLAQQGAVKSPTGIEEVAQRRCQANSEGKRAAKAKS